LNSSYYYWKKFLYLGVEMKNLLVGIIIGLFVTSNAGVLLYAHATEVTFEIHYSVKVTTPLVKDHGVSLLIELPEATA
jgi:hypothetical protein